MTVTAQRANLAKGNPKTYRHRRLRHWLIKRWQTATRHHQRKQQHLRASSQGHDLADDVSMLSQARNHRTHRTSSSDLPGGTRSPLLTKTFGRILLPQFCATARTRMNIGYFPPTSNNASVEKSGAGTALLVVKIWLLKPCTLKRLASR